MSLQAVTTSDGHVAVVADGRLTLYALDRGTRVASVEVVGDGVVACGSHLLVHAHDNLASLLTLFSTPDLTAISCVELAAPTRLLGATASFALIDRGDQAFVVQTAGGNLAVVPLRPPASFDAALGVDGESFLAFGRRGTETWDAVERRPLARLGLTLPDDVREYGITLRGSALWISTARPGLIVARLSDGRVTPLRLDGPARAVRGHRALSWLVAQVGADQIAINLALRVIEPLDQRHGPVIALAPVRDRDSSAYAIAFDGARLVTQLLGGDGGRTWGPSAAPVLEPEDGPTPPRPEPTPAPTPSAAPPREAPRVQTVSDRLAARLGRGPGAGAAPTVTPDGPGPEPKPATTPPSLAPAAAPSPHPIVAASALPAPAALTPPAPSAEPAPSIPPVPVVAPPRPRLAPPVRVASARPHVDTTAPTGPIATLGDDWRDTLLTWARAAAAPVPALADTPLAMVHERVAGTAATWPILCALYGAWLDGAGDRGLAIAELAARAAPAGDRWLEALGVGTLDHAGLVTWDRGRAQLAPGVGEFLDGRPPRAIEVITAGARRPPGPGLFRIDVDAERTPRMAALDLVEQIGVLAWCEPDPTPPRVARAALERGRLEAWLRGFPMATPVDVSALTVRAGECVLWLARAGTAAHPAAPPPWRP